MSRNRDVPAAARTAHRCGQLSVASVFVAIIAGFSIDFIGVNGLFSSFVIPLALVAILLSLSARRGMDSRSSPGYSEATRGLWMGLLVLFLVGFFMVIVVILSLLLLLAQ